MLLAYSGHAASSGAINITNVSSLSPVWLVIEDIGPADVIGGIDRGAGAGSGTTLTYTSRFDASSINVYTGAGGLRADAGGYGFQGYSPSATSYGDQHSVIFFANNAVIGQTAQTLATVSTQTGFSLKKATLFLYYNYCVLRAQRQLRQRAVRVDRPPDGGGDRRLRRRLQRQ